MTIYPIDSLFIELDSLTPDYTHSLEVIETDSVDFVALLNGLTNTIYFYAIETGKLGRTVRFEKGETGIRNDIMSFFPHNKDSVFLFTHGLFSYLGNYDGDILDRYPTLDLSYRQGLYATSTSPFLYRNAKFYYNSIVFGYYDQTYAPLMCYDTRSQSVNTYGRLPSVYFKGDWGGFPYDYIYQVHDKRNDRIVFSFPAHNELVTSAFSDTLAPAPGTSFMSTLNPPFHASGEHPELSPEWNDKINTSPIFGEMFLDEHNGRIYRVYKYPVPFPQASEKWPKRRTSLVAYSNELDLLHEIILADKYTYEISSAFMYKGKFFVRVRIEDEDWMKFMVFELPD